MKLASLVMAVTFAVCAGVAIGDDTLSQEGKESLALNKSVSLNKTIFYDNAYDEEVTSENTAKSSDRHSEKSAEDSVVEINTEIIQ